MLSRTQLRQFLAVVDCGSFTRAAATLSITQPSLSGGVAELERQLGTRLFIRERRRIRLTPAGNALLPLARSIERDFHEAERRVGNLLVPARPLRVGVLETLPLRWLERAVELYAGPDPLELTEGGERELQAALSTGSLDLAVSLVPDNAPGALFREEYCLALPAGHALAGRDSVPPEAVAGETMMARRSCEVLAETSRYFTEHGVRPRFALRSGHDEKVMGFVRAGLGVTVAPRSLAGPGIAMVGLDGFDRHRTVGLVCGTHDPPGAEPLAQALRGALVI